MANYITEVQGNTYMAGRLNAEAWENATSPNREKAITTATRAMDRLNYLGCKTAEAQVNQFPRDADAAVPQDIMDACAEEALALLDGRDPELEFENLVMTDQRYANIRSAYDRSTPAENIVAGIISVMAWRYIKPYLRDPYTMSTCRTS